MFHDEVELWLESGKGGDGSASFRREKYIPKGGPDGGDGGVGGNVLIKSSNQTHALNHLAAVRELKAENGIAGQGKKLYGRKGEDLEVTVPVGTRIYRQTQNGWRLVADLTEDNRSVKVLRGGTGGLGNVHFATATHQTPRYAQPGEPGEKAFFKLEVLLIADVGIIGLPNAGKSTFLSIVTEAKPKIAHYPFTTLSPVLGVAHFHEKQFIFADIPGLIEGAAQGKGLGHTFLRHVQPTKVLLHFIDALSSDYAKDYLTIRNELAQFNPELVTKQEIVVITKSELITDQDDFETKLDKLRQTVHLPSHIFSDVTISAVTQQHIQTLMAEIARLLDKNK